MIVLPQKRTRLGQIADSLVRRFGNIRGVWRVYLVDCLYISGVHIIPRDDHLEVKLILWTAGTTIMQFRQNRDGTLSLHMSDDEVRKLPVWKYRFGFRAIYIHQESYRYIMESISAYIDGCY